MEKKTFPPRRSSTLLRRAAALAVLMLAAQTALWAYTVTLRPGRGTGSDIVINSGETSLYAANQSSAANGQFWLEGSDLWYKFPDCPGTFTAPAGEVLMGWYVGYEGGPTLEAGKVYQITGDLVLIAKWGAVEYDYDDVEVVFKYAISNKSPREVKITRIDGDKDGNVTIPASVEHGGETYSVVEIADKVGEDNFDMTTLTIPATVRRIGTEAFQNCENLGTVTFQEGSQLTSAGKDAFLDCQSLKYIYNIPCNVKSDDGDMFGSSYGLEEVTIWGNNGSISQGWGMIWNVGTVKMTVPANPFGEDYWTTFYNGGANFQADGNTTVYKAELIGSSLQLHEVADRIINRGQPVILKSTGNPVLTKNKTESSNTERNDLQGSGYDEEPGPGTYVLDGGAQGLGFYPFSGTTLQGGKAYIIISSGGSERGYVGMNEEPTVGTVGIQHHADTRKAAQEAAEGWFTLDGRALSGRPATPGLYIQKGRKVMIK